MTTPSMHDLLVQGREEIKRVGLCKGSYSADPTDPNSPCCMLGAMTRVGGREGFESFLADEQLYYYMRQVVADNSQFSSVGGFNDYPGTTLEDVVEMFDKMINGNLDEDGSS